MKTTQMYIELVVIGLETSIWICIMFINLLGSQISRNILYILDNWTTSILVFGVLYIVGVLSDRLSDLVFQCIEQTVRRQSGLEAKTSIIIWEKYNQEKFSDYTRSRIRILRASIINIPLITLGSIWYLFQINGQYHEAVLFILFLGGIATYISQKSYIKLVKGFYQKAHILEMERKEVESECKGK